MPRYALDWLGWPEIQAWAEQPLFDLNNLSMKEGWFSKQENEEILT